jgi:hypothetical protein
LPSGGAGQHFLAFLHLGERRRQGFQHAVEAGAHVQLVHLALFQVVLALQLIHFHLGCGELRLVRLRVDLQALQLKLVLFGKLLGLGGGDLGVDLRNQAVLGQRLVAVGLQLGIVHIAFGLRGLRLHVEQRLFERDLEVFKIGLRGFEQVLGVQQSGLQLRAGHHHHQGIGLDRRARLDQNALDAGVGVGRDQHGVFRDQRAQAAHFAHHGAALHGVRPQGRHLRRRCGWLEALDPKKEAGHHRQRARLR